MEAGGRTGLTTLTTPMLMLVALLFTPLILAVPAVLTIIAIPLTFSIAQ